MKKSTIAALLVLAVPIGIAIYINRKNLKSKGANLAEAGI